MQIKNPTSYAGVNYHSNDTAQSFSHPDFTVGSGISPDQLLLGITPDPEELLFHLCCKDSTLYPRMQVSLHEKWIHV